MVVLAVEVCEVRRIEWKQATYLPKRSVRPGLVGTFPAAQVSGQVRFRMKESGTKAGQKDPQDMQYHSFLSLFSFLTVRSTAVMNCGR
jgi:hypothetical protein